MLFFVLIKLRNDGITHKSTNCSIARPGKGAQSPTNRRILNGAATASHRAVRFPVHCVNLLHCVGRSSRHPQQHRPAVTVAVVVAAATTDTFAPRRQHGQERRHHHRGQRRPHVTNNTRGKCRGENPE
jgi:hypothetical protein